MRAVLKMLESRGLDISESQGELVITNPRDPEKGKVSIDTEDGYVSWEHLAWQHWGPFCNLDDHEQATAVAARIISALTQ